MLQVRPRVTTEPLGTVRALSKLSVNVAPRLVVLSTREPVLRAVVPFVTWQFESVVVAEPEPVKVNGRDERRTSSPDCEASSWKLAKSTLAPPATTVCEVGLDETAA